MYVVIAAGGTAGHINPAIALAHELTSRGHTVSFIGTPNGLEATLVPEAGFKFFELTSTGFDRAHISTLFSAFYHILRGSQILRAEFKRTKPDLVIGFGAYLELAAANAARSLKIPLAIHEQNSVPGLANKLLARFARLIAISYPSTEPIFAQKKSKAASIVLTGNPVRNSVLSANREAGRKLYSIPDDALMVLVFGGSLGARHINQAVLALKDKLLEQPNVYLVHAVGQKAYEELISTSALNHDEQKRYIIKDYIKNMGDTLKASDVVVSRAGATSIAEISALAVPSVLVPYPFATENHQHKNAEYLAQAQAAIIIEDDKLDSDEFSQALFKLISSPELRSNMRMRALELSGEGAAYKLANALESVVRE